MSMLDRIYVNTETQLGVAVPTGIVAWASGLNWVAILSCILIVGQIGLLIPKYIKVFQEWRAKRGNKK